MGARSRLTVALVLLATLGAATVIAGRGLVEDEPVHKCIHDTHVAGKVDIRRVPQPYDPELVSRRAEAGAARNRLRDLIREFRVDNPEYSEARKEEISSFLHRTQTEFRRSTEVSQTYGAGDSEPLKITVVTDYLTTDDRRCTTVGEEVEVGVPTGSPPPACDSDTVQDDCMYTCEEGNILTDDKKVYMESLVEFALEYATTHLNSLPVTGAMSVDTSGGDTCGVRGGFTVSNAISGISTDDRDGAHMILVLTARPTPDGVLAYAGHCQTDQYDRPTLAYLNVGPNSLSPDDETSLRSDQGVATHELTHALGFSENSFANMRIDYQHSTKYTEPVVAGYLDDPSLDSKDSMYVKSTDGYIREVNFLATPNVVDWVEEHFNCRLGVLSGAELEDQGGDGTAGSHWEKRVFMDEFMTGTASSKPVFSGLTLAFFEDSGWYDVQNKDQADVLLWGKDMNCPFALQNCGSWEDLTQADSFSFAYLCGTGVDDTECGPSDSGILEMDCRSCTYDHLAQGRCLLTEHGTSALSEQYHQYFPASPGWGGQAPNSDYCPYVRPNSNGDCRVSTNGAIEYSSGAESYNPEWFGENYGGAARCHQSTILQETLTSDSLSPISCHDTVCHEDGKYMVKVGRAHYECTAEGNSVGGGGAGGYNGRVLCANPQIICPEFETRWADAAALLVFPTLQSVSPSSGLIIGGDTITLTGTNFDEGSKVYVSRVECANVKFVSSTSITCETKDMSDSFADDTQEQSGQVVVERGDNGLTATIDNGITLSAEDNALSLTALIEFWEDTASPFISDNPVAVGGGLAFFVVVGVVVCLKKRNNKKNRIGDGYVIR